MSILGAKSLQKDTINFTKNYKNQKSKNELQEFLNKFRNEKGSKKYNITFLHDSSKTFLPSLLQQSFSSPSPDRYPSH